MAKKSVFSGQTIPYNYVIIAAKIPHFRPVARIYYGGGGGGGEGFIPQELEPNNQCWMIGNANAEERRLLRSRGTCSPGKILSLRSSVCWKCNEIVNPTITMLFCIILNILRSHQADLLDSWCTCSGYAHGTGDHLRHIVCIVCFDRFSRKETIGSFKR